MSEYPDLCDSRPDAPCDCDYNWGVNDGWMNSCHWRYPSAFGIQPSVLQLVCKLKRNTNKQTKKVYVFIHFKSSICFNKPYDCVININNQFKSLYLCHVGHTKHSHHAFLFSTSSCCQPHHHRRRRPRFRGCFVALTSSPLSSPGPVIVPDLSCLFKPVSREGL